VGVAHVVYPLVRDAGRRDEPLVPFPQGIRVERLAIGLREDVPTVGADGERLLEALTAPNAPEPLAPLPAVAVLRRVWKAEFTVVAGQLQLRGPKALPAAADQIEPPYEPAARSATKRELHWVGYVDIVGPIPADQQWQAKAQTGFEVSRFVVDGEAPVVTCPRDRLQYVATAAAMNMGRLVDWLDEIPRAQTRRSRFAALDPAA